MKDHYELHRRALACIAQGALTNSKRPSCFLPEIYPSHVSHGKGCYLWDHTGKKYTDFICGLGVNILGYAQDKVNAAIAARLALGATLSLSTHVELEVAEKLKEMFTFVDAWKFLKTGSEACSAAVRIALAKTGRQRVLSQAYHGWHDGFVSLTEPALGVTNCPDFAKLHDGWDDDDSVGAIIIEPVVTDWSDARRKYLQDLRDKCTKRGIMLIFDEVITGFRWPKFSVAEHWNITPDLICLGKAMANGLPLAAIGGKYAVMNCDEYFVSSTFAGETLSLAAAKQTLLMLQTTHRPEKLWERGAEFLAKFNELWPEKVSIEGYPTRGAFVGDPLIKGLLFQEACKAGILFGSSWFLSFPAIDELENTLEVCADIIGRLKIGAVKLEGTLPVSPFAQKLRETS